MEFDPARVGSLVLDRALSAGNISPPSGKTTGHQNRWGVGELPIKPATQTTAIEQPFSTKLLAFDRRIEEPGFCNSL
jgi:hypothetical protein